MPSPLSRDSAVKAISLGVLSSSAYTLAHILVRQVGGTGVHAFQIAFLRTAVCFLIIWAISFATRSAGLRARQPGIIILRGLLSAAGILLWFYGLVHLPLAEATTLAFTRVCFAAAAATVVLREPLTLRKLLAILLAIGGAAAVIRPGFASFQIESFAVVGAAACWGVAACLVRSASRTEDSITIALWTSLLITLFSAVPASVVWQTPTGHELLLLGLIGLLTALGTLAWTQAFKFGEATLVTMTDFTQLVWAIVIGLYFCEVPGFWSVFGISLIFCATAAISLDAAGRATARGNPGH